MRMTRIFIVFFVFLLSISSLNAMYFGAGAKFSPSKSNVTYIVPSSGLTTNTTVITAYCVILGGGTFNGTWCYTSPTHLDVFFGNLNFRIYNEENNTLLVTEEMFIELVNADFNYTLMTTIATGQYSLSAPDGNYEIRYYNANHYIRSKFVSINSFNSNLTIPVISAYALNNSVGEPLDVQVRTFSMKGIPNATVVLQRWYSNTGIWTPVAEGITDPNGKFRFYVNKVNAYYRILVNYGGSTIFQSNGELIHSTDYLITTDIYSYYKPWARLDGELILHNATLPYYFEFSWSNKASSIISVCLDTFEEAYLGYDVNKSTCSSATSGSIIHFINENKSYKALSYYDLANASIIEVSEQIYTAIKQFGRTMKDVAWAFAMVLILAITFGALYVTRDLSSTSVAFTGSLLVCKIIGLISIQWWSFGILIPATLLILYYQQVMR